MKINYLGYEKKYNERTGETHYDKNSYRLAVITVNTNKQSEMDLFYKIAEKEEEEGYRYDWAGGDEEYAEAFFEVEDKADYLYFKRIYMKVKRTKNETTEVEISETTAETETAEEVVESVEETTVSETATVEETAEQETELNAEVAQVEAEQTAEPETFSKSKSESESEPTAENITVSGTNQGNINVLIVADIANTFEMITHTGYFDTS